jgi:peroxiredoxin
VDEAQNPQPSRHIAPNLTRLAVAAIVIAVGVVALWQAGIIFTSDTAHLDNGDSTIDLQPADASIDTVAVAGRDVGLDQGDLAPDFEFSGFDGQRMRLSDFRGRPVFVTFWATWCLPCRQEMPQMDELLRQYQPQGLAVIAVNNGERFNPARAFIEKLGVNLTAVAYDPGQDVVRKYQVLGMPTSFFIDADGVITQVVRGELSRSNMEFAINQAIAGHANLN